MHSEIKPCGVVGAVVGVVLNPDFEYPEVIAMGCKRKQTAAVGRGYTRFMIFRKNDSVRIVFRVNAEFRTNYVLDLLRDANVVIFLLHGH